MEITPRPLINKNGRLALKEGDEIGPYNCSADCNPPCQISWKFEDKIGFHSLTEKEELRGQVVNRNMSLLRCIAHYNETKEENYNISLDVQCMYHILAKD